MPRYFFDIAEGDRIFADNEGTELEDDDDARDEALETLGQIAKDKLPEGKRREFVATVRHGDRREFIIAVRDGHRKVLTATLSLRVDREGQVRRLPSPARSRPY